MHCGGLSLGCERLIQITNHSLVTRADVGGKYTLMAI